MTLRVEWTRVFVVVHVLLHQASKEQKVVLLMSSQDAVPVWELFYNIECNAYYMHYISRLLKTLPPWQCVSLEVDSSSPMWHMETGRCIVTFAIHVLQSTSPGMSHLPEGVRRSLRDPRTSVYFSTHNRVNVGRTETKPVWWLRQCETGQIETMISPRILSWGNLRQNFWGNLRRKFPRPNLDWGNVRHPTTGVIWDTPLRYPSWHPMKVLWWC